MREISDLLIEVLLTSNFLLLVLVIQANTFLVGSEFEVSLPAA